VITSPFLGEPPDWLSKAMSVGKDADLYFN